MSHSASQASTSGGIALTVVTSAVHQNKKIRSQVRRATGSMYQLSNCAGVTTNDDACRDDWHDGPAHDSAAENGSTG